MARPAKNHKILLMGLADRDLTRKEVSYVFNDDGERKRPTKQPVISALLRKMVGQGFVVRTSRSGETRYSITEEGRYYLDRLFRHFRNFDEYPRALDLPRVEIPIMGVESWDRARRLLLQRGRSDPRYLMKFETYWNERSLRFEGNLRNALQDAYALLFKEVVGLALSTYDKGLDLDLEADSDSLKGFEDMGRYWGITAYFTAASSEKAAEVHKRNVKQWRELRKKFAPS